MYAYARRTFCDKEKQFSRIYALSKGLSPTVMKQKRKVFYCLRSFAGEATPRKKRKKN